MTSPAEMDCQDLVELVSDYLEGAVSPDRRAEIDAHLASCEGCTAYLEQMRTTIRLSGMLGEDQIPPELKEPLLAAFRSWRSET
jgi:predicted anti-sigma-YlaC factor YlaD